MMLGQLLPAGGGPSVPLFKPRLVLGRKPECDVVVEAKGVSGRHCELAFKEGRWYVRDLDSRNGTGINNRRVTTQRIMPDDVLIVGKQRYKIRYTLPKDEQTRQVDAAEDMALSLLADDDETPAAGDKTVRPGEKRRQRPARSQKQSKEQRPTEQQPPRQQPAAERPSSDLSAQPTAPRMLSKKPTEPSPTKPQPSGTGSRSSRRLLGRLIPCGGGDPIALMQESLLVGRRSHCDLQFKHGTVSSEHCRLIFEDGYWFIEDLNSHNGVRVDGVKVQRECILPDVVISIARMRFTLDYRQPTDGPPPMEQPFAKSLLAKAGLEEDLSGSRDSSWVEVDDEAEQVTQKKYTLDPSELDEDLDL